MKPPSTRNRLFCLPNINLLLHITTILAVCHTIHILFILRELIFQLFSPYSLGQFGVLPLHLLQQSRYITRPCGRRSHEHFPRSSPTSSHPDKSRVVASL